MSVFAVVATEVDKSKVTKLGGAIQSMFGDDCCALKNGSWLISDKSILRPQDLFKKLFGEDTSTSCLVVPVNAYWGIQHKDVWDWLGTKEL